MPPSESHTLTPAVLAFQAERRRRKNLEKGYGDKEMKSVKNILDTLLKKPRYIGVPVARAASGPLEGAQVEAICNIDRVVTYKYKGFCSVSLKDITPFNVAKEELEKYCRRRYLEAQFLTDITRAGIFSFQEFMCFSQDSRLWKLGVAILESQGFLGPIVPLDNKYIVTDTVKARGKALYAKILEDPQGRGWAKNKEAIARGARQIEYMAATPSGTWVTDNHVEGLLFEYQKEYIKFKGPHEGGGNLEPPVSSDDFPSMFSSPIRQAAVHTDQARIIRADLPALKSLSIIASAYIDTDPEVLKPSVKLNGLDFEETNEEVREASKEGANIDAPTTTTSRTPLPKKAGSLWFDANYDPIMQKLFSDNIPPRPTTVIPLNQFNVEYKNLQTLVIYNRFVKAVAPYGDYGAVMAAADGLKKLVNDARTQQVKDITEKLLALLEEYEVEKRGVLAEQVA
ncbi:hypothetical protein P7C71_g2480, partial [Lecanoromycetidae sp. Uapishka_2]